MRNYWTQERIAGLLLVLGLLIAVAAGVVIVSSGVNFGRMLNPGVEGLEEIADFQSVYRLSVEMGGVGILVSLLGLAMLAGLLRQAGDPAFALAGLASFTVSTALFMTDLAFHMSVAGLVAEQTQRTGVVPDFYAPMRAWVGTMQSLSITAGLVAMLGFGVSIARTDLLPRWLGWASLVWSGFLLLIRLVSSGMPVGVIILMPAFIGFVLLGPGGRRASTTEEAESGG